LPGRTAVRHRTFLSFPNTVGKPLSLEIPEPLGPRKRVQPLRAVSREIVSAPRHSRQSNGHSNLGIPQLSHSGFGRADSELSGSDPAHCAKMKMAVFAEIEIYL
jgi:hypothetical protein